MHLLNQWSVNVWTLYLNVQCVCWDTKHNNFTLVYLYNKNVIKWSDSDSDSDSECTGLVNGILSDSEPVDYPNATAFLFQYSLQN